MSLTSLLGIDLLEQNALAAFIELVLFRLDELGLSPSHFVLLVKRHTCKFRALGRVDRGFDSYPFRDMEKVPKRS